MIKRLQVQSQQPLGLTRNSDNNLTLGPGYGYENWNSRLNKGFSSRFFEDSRVRCETPEEGRRTYRQKRSEYNNKDEVNSPNILSNNKQFHIDHFQTDLI